MPNRILREGILTSERVARLAWAEEVFYRRLMSAVDDFGRYYANPALLRAMLYPLQIDKVSDSDIAKWLTACVNAALVRVYPAKDGKRYLELLDFRQQVRAKESKFPAYEPHVVSAGSADATQLHSRRAADAHLDVSGDEDVSVDAKPTASSAEPTAAPNREEAGKARAGKALPPCPYQAVVDLYHELLPELPRVRVMDDERKKGIASLWKFILTSRRPDGTARASSADEAVEWIRVYFGRARENDFVMARTARGAGHENWQASLDYLCTSRGLKQVIEKTKEAA